MSKLIENANVAKYKPNVVLASLFSLSFVIIGSILGSMFFIPNLKDFQSTAFNNLILGFLPIILVTFLYVKVIEKRGPRSMGFEEKGHKKYLLGFAFGLAMFSLAVLLATLLGGMTMTWSFKASFIPAILTILLGFLIQGAAEEVVFRGWVLPIVGARYNVKLAIVVSSILFAFLHGLNPGITILPVINLVLFGVFAAFYALQEESLWGICGFHSAWNWVQGSVFGVKVSGTTVPGGSFFESVPKDKMDLISGGAFGIEGSILCSLIFILGIVYCIRKMRLKHA
ncbi:CPBP family intramembrane metalloprotease [Acidaminobacter sp. JC074]|uniref:CPBP family intramembrane glutamic endopeptidase n=1 Tax=Acidaminobacter sp. JC074 TaxID=2530199 RepID=UPI001F1015B4|nr:type II CAAX endopeptidase family protein [Acidaminobacter sp. JC074]MCH4889814.1 CPBP family intramembrane metalloprotease [Acidaminobacter sp. JC074]